MKVQLNPMIEITKGDEIAIKRVNDICEMLICTLAEHTFTDDACIICADNGEVFVTEKELYSTLDVLTRMTRIASEAPIDCNACKMLAVEFIK